MWDKLAEPDHPIWKSARLFVIGIIVVIYCATQYNNPINWTDVGLLVSLLAGVGGYDQIKDKIVEVLRTK